MSQRGLNKNIGNDTQAVTLTQGDLGAIAHLVESIIDVKVPPMIEGVVSRELGTVPPMIETVVSKELHDKVPPMIETVMSKELKDKVPSIIEGVVSKELDTVPPMVEAIVSRQFSMVPPMIEGVVSRELGKFAIMVKKGFDDMHERLDNMVGEFNEFKGETEQNFYGLKSDVMCLKSSMVKVEHRLDRVETKLDMFGSMWSNHEDRIIQLESR